MESRVEAIGPMLDALGRFTEFTAAHAEPAAVAVVREWVEKFLMEERRRNG